MKIGDTVYWFNPNRRFQVYSEFFIETKITGETKTQWITGFGMKFNKKPKAGATPQRHSSHVDRLYTAAEVEDAIYINNSRHLICDKVRDCADANVMRQIAELLGGVT